MFITYLAGAPAGVSGRHTRYARCSITNLHPRAITASFQMRRFTSTQQGAPSYIIVGDTSGFWGFAPPLLKSYLSPHIKPLDVALKPVYSVHLIVLKPISTHLAMS